VKYRGETIASILVFVVLAALGLAVFVQKDCYDPALYRATARVAVPRSAPARDALVPVRDDVGGSFAPRPREDCGIDRGDLSEDTREVAP